MDPADIDPDAVLWLVWLDVDFRSALCDRLQWVLNTDERLLAVLWGSVHDAISGMATATWCLPTAGCYCCARDAFLHHAEVEHSRPWQELGELSLSRRPGYNGGHDIETTLDGRKLHLQATSGTAVRGWRDGRN
jgi:hypothetical protein